eukprot:8076300-Prorocentrum_lima.AAC.1
MTSSLVGSEMCIRDSMSLFPSDMFARALCQPRAPSTGPLHWIRHPMETVSYTHLTLPTICSV